jgi:hypothetical protein
MGVAELDEAGAFGVLGEAALKLTARNWSGFRPDGRMIDLPCCECGLVAARLTHANLRPIIAANEPDPAQTAE